MLHTTNPIIKHKVGLLNLAEALDQYNAYEKEILDIYGPLRGMALKPSPMADATTRYTNIKDHFN